MKYLLNCYNSTTLIKFHFIPLKLNEALYFVKIHVQLSHHHW